MVMIVLKQGPANNIDPPYISQISERYLKRVQLDRSKCKASYVIFCTNAWNSSRLQLSYKKKVCFHLPSIINDHFVTYQRCLYETIVYFPIGTASAHLGWNKHGMIKIPIVHRSLTTRLNYFDDLWHTLFNVICLISIIHWTKPILIGRSIHNQLS